MEDTIRSIAISLECFGANQVVVIHHTDCRMPLIGSDELLPSPQGPVWGNVGAQEDLRSRPLDPILRCDLEALRPSPFIGAEVEISGAIYDVRTGRLQRFAGYALEADAVAA